MEREKHIDPTAVDIPELVPIEQYNINEARISAYISWLVTKAYGNSVPSEFQEPLCEGTNGESQLKPSFVEVLTSSELYCKACAQLFKDLNIQWKGHMDVIQTLSRKGIYVTDPHESAVTDTLLQQKNPFKLSCHLSLIEALMTAWTNEIVSVERVVQAVRKFSSFNASSELPFDTEDALLFWMNKVCGTVRHRIGKGELIVTDPHHVMVPVMDDLLKDLTDGCCLCVLISFYCPNTLRLQDIALKDPISIADSLYNIQLIRLFCEHYLPEKCDHLTVNDIFHGVSDLKVSFVVLVAELFNWLEVKKISVCADVRKNLQTRNMTDAEDRPCTAKKLTSPSVAVPPVSISNVTKRSFQQTGASEQLMADMSGISPDMHKTSLVMPRQPLLPRRLQQGQIGNLEDNKSELAWPGSNGDSKPLPQYSSVQSQLTSVTALSGTSTNTSSHLLGNVSMDSELSMDFTESSVDISEFEDTPRRTPIGPIQRIGGATLAGPGHPDYLELQSVTPILSSRLSEHQNSASEREASQNNQNSHCLDLIMKAPNDITSRNPRDGNPTGGNPTSGNLRDGNPRGGSPRSGNGNPHPGSNIQQSNPHIGNPNPQGGNPNPQGGNPGNGQGSESQVEKLMPAHLKPAKEKLNNSHTKEIESGEVTVVRSPTSPSKQPPRSLNLGSQVNSIVMGGNDSDGSTPDEDYQTPSMESVPLPGEKQSVNVEDNKPQSSLSEPSHAEPKRRQYEAFYVDPDSTLSSNIPLGDGVRSTRTPVTESFVLPDQHHTVESARAAGLPVVAAAGHRLGDPSSGESSDPELQKLRADHQARETEGSPRPTQGQRPESLTVKSDPDKSQKTKDEESPKTSFAQIKQEKENGDLSSARFGSKNQETGFSLKSQFQKGKAGVKIQKKTTFAALPNQTTWQENAVSATKQRDSNRAFHEGDVSPTSSELIDIKMRLEERRRQIENEKRRMEMQWTKQRQRLGKQAFIQVINRGKSESDLRQAKEEDLSATERKSGKVLDADERLSSLIKSRAGKVEEASPAVLKGSSAPASREQSLDREQSVSSAVVSKLHKPPRSEASKEEKAFSLASSHDKLTRSADSAKEMFSEGEPVLSQTQISPVKTRPKSYHAPDRTHPVPATTGMSGKPEPMSGQSSLTSSTEKPNLGSSSTSLDRLNTSLSELQGEIMRLSLQQDQIKSMVVHEREPAKTSQSPAPVQAPPSRDDKYYLYPRNAVGEPDIISAKTEPAQPVAAVAQVTQPTAGAAGACVAQPIYTPSQQPTQVAGVQYSNQPQPPYGTMPSYPAQYPFVGNHPQPAGMYTLPQQYTGMPQPQYQATNIYQTPQMYQQQIPGYSGMPHNQWHPGMPSISHAAPSGQSPYGNNTFQPVLQPHSMTSVQSPIQRTTGTPDYSPDHHYKAPSGYSMGTSAAPGHGVMAHSQVPLGLHSPVQSPALSSPVPSTPPVSGVLPSPDHSLAEPQHPVGEPQSEGFFVGLDSERKLEPASVKDKDATQISQPEDDKKMSDAGPSVPQYVDISPVGFVVGEEETDVSVEMSEMEKKRQKLFELQMKRREEQERKRLKKEKEMAKKREEQQAKQEELQRKKAEEKMRREAIFQEYLRRKEQDSGGEEEPKIAAAVQKRAHSKSRSKTTRPKSQPPAAAVEDVPVAPPVAASSVAVPPRQSGDQTDETRSSPTNDIAGKQTGHLMTFPVAPGNGEQTDTNYQQLAFGGLTHRRPPTPERPTRLFLDNSSDSSSNPSSSDYTGPKLFKKPSQKSNRHIIVNAISHCCLAGTVNTAVKDKVLDIMSKSDAKHFVILFRDGGQQFKALYTYDPEREEVLKIHGVGPRQLTDDMMERFYKYNSGAKSFTEVTSTKHLSATIDAVVIHNHLWQKKTTTTKRAPNQY